MAYGVSTFLPRRTQKPLNETVKGAVHPCRSSSARGQIFHAAGFPKADRPSLPFTIGRSWEKFRDGTMVPRMQQGMRVGSKIHLKKQDSRLQPAP